MVVVLDDLSTGKRENLNPSASLIEGDVANPQTVRQLVANADAVIHLAAIASVERCEVDIEASHRTNFTGTLTVCSAAAEAGIKVVYASSAAVYGDNQEIPLHETSRTHPLSRYGADKLASEQVAQQLAKEEGLRSVGLRFFNVYGPRQDPNSPYSGVISKFMATAKAGEQLTFFGDGEQTRDFIWVGDIVALILAALDSSAEGAVVFNGCTGHATSLKELAATLAEVTGCAITTRHASPRVGDIRHSLGNPDAASNDLGFAATTPLKEGLAQLAQQDA